MAGTVHDVENKNLLAQVKEESANAARELAEAARLHKGQIVVVGYFGYAGLLLGKGIGAAASIPGNLVQAVMGLAIGLILFFLLKRSKALDKLGLQ